MKKEENITLDKLKLVTKSKYIKDLDLNKFINSGENNFLYKQKEPYSIIIKISNMKNELFVEFSGKILGKNYPKLISKDTIKECLKNINNLGICQIDFDSILSDSNVTACDITTDIEYRETEEISAYLRNNIKNYRSHVARLLRNGNFIIFKNVTSKGSMKKLTIYNKGQEINRSENHSFRNTYGIAAADFEDITRFELSLNTMEQIRQALHIESTQLMNVLNCSAAPISDFVKEFLCEETECHQPTNMQEYRMNLILKDCDYDMQKIEIKLKSIYAPGSNWSKVFAPYRKALRELNSKEGKTMRETILSLVEGK